MKAQVLTFNVLNWLSTAEPKRLVEELVGVESRNIALRVGTIAVMRGVEAKATLNSVMTLVQERVSNLSQDGLPVPMNLDIICVECMRWLNSLERQLPSMPDDLGMSMPDTM